jgi:dynein heavy chain 1
VQVERVLFLGACNPPTDPGRFPMSDRFLRHAPLILVDYPSPESFRQIYGTFMRALLKTQPDLSGLADSLTYSMVDVWFETQRRFTTETQPHYLYSPRELTRWKVAISEAMAGLPGMSPRDLIRLFINEGERIFGDRLVFEEEHEWTSTKFDEVSTEHMGASGRDLEKPILFSTYLTGTYSEVSREDLRQYIHERLRVFNEEELNVELVIFDEALEHIVRIDRVLRQPLGHLLLVGASGAGKTVLSKFVSWMNGLSLFQIKCGRNYTIENFETDLRVVRSSLGSKGARLRSFSTSRTPSGPHSSSA